MADCSTVENDAPTRGITLSGQLRPRPFDPLERHRKRRPQLLRVERDLELLEQPAKRREPGRPRTVRSFALFAVAIARPPLRELRRVPLVAAGRLEMADVAALERLQVTRQMLQLRPWRGGKKARVDERVALCAEQSGESRMRYGRSR